MILRNQIWKSLRFQMIRDTASSYVSLWRGATVSPFGNSLRRIMLSSLPGTAVSRIKINGVLHEFSSIPDVKEDVTEIVMNVKELAIKNHATDPAPKTAYIDFEGEGVVRASDIQVDSDIEIMNPDQVIATLNSGPDAKAQHGADDH